MIQHSTQLLDDFSKQLNSRFNLMDFLEAESLFVKFLESKTQSNIVYPLTLPCDRPIFLQLANFGYRELLESLVSRMTIIDEATDVYCSKIEKETFGLFKSIVEHEVKKAKVVTDVKEGVFQIRCSQLMMELIWSPVSQFHGEVVNQLAYFERLIVAKSLTSSRTDAIASIFLNSKAPTPYSYFILAFLAENLGIPLQI